MASSSPDAGERQDWYDVVTAMLDASEAGSCGAIPLPSGLAGLYELSAFTDASDAREYCVLAEIALVGHASKKAWGSFVTSLAPERELAVQVAHPLGDLDTWLEGVTVFGSARARSFLLSGAHRNANDANSSCQSSFKESDAAHETAHMFQPSTQATLDWYTSEQLDGLLRVIQFHGMGTSTCPGVDVYMTYGLGPGAGNPAPGDDLLGLQAALQAAHPGWVVVVPGGTPTCTLNATTNTQGRLLNGVAPTAVCGTAAAAYSGRFIHIEQKRDFRDPQDWLGAIEATWPVANPVPGLGRSGLLMLCAALVALGALAVERRGLRRR